MKPAILLLAFAAFAQDPPVILAPTSDSTVAPGPLRIIARAPGKAQLLLDGKPIAVTEPLAGVMHAEVPIAEGKHELVLKAEGGGSAAIRFTSAKPGNFRAHPPGSPACDTCHAVKNETWAMKRATLAPLCGQCHDRAKFVSTHTHNTDILADCQNCHLPHGSAAKVHLQKPKEVVCKQCHS